MTEDDPVPAAPHFLAHGGAMAARIHALDWQDTRLGLLDNWPSTLKCMLAMILDSPRPMYVLWGAELLFFFNNAYAPMLGERLSAAIGRPFSQVWPELWADFEPMLRQALGGQASSRDNVPLTLARHGHPEPTWWTFSYLPLRDERGAVLGVRCVCIETTALVRLQETLAVKQKQQAFRVELGGALRGASDPQALRAVAARMLGEFLQASCVGYAQIDASGDYAVVPQDWTAGAFPSMVGTHRLDHFGAWEAQQLHAGRTVAVHDIGQAPRSVGQAKRHKAFIKAPLLENERLAMILFVLNAEPRAWAESEQALVEEVAKQTWTASQQLQAQFDLRHSHQALDQRTAQLLCSDNALRQSQKLEALGQLTGGVAHDFNNLLAIISASVELLRNARLPWEQRGPYLDRIFNTVGRATRLTGQLLAFARKKPLSPEVFDVDLKVQEVLDLVRPLMGRQVRITHQPCGTNACFAEADISQFETALLNLAVNARDAMDANGQLTVQVRKVDAVPPGPGHGARAGDFISISVSDTGCGIAPDKLETVFEPFYTTKEVGRGTGLGLSQVFGFAKQAGGEIKVSSELGAGSVFTLYLARAESLPPLPASLAGPEARAQGRAAGSGVLVVEDNETLGEMTCEILNALGYRAVWAGNAAAALHLLARQSSAFDLVFSDVVMPGMSGIELGKKVRLLYPGLPVVLTSGSNAILANEGPYGFEMVLKPYTSATLVRVFRKAIAQQA